MDNQLSLFPLTNTEVINALALEGSTDNAIKVFDEPSDAQLPFGVLPSDTTRFFMTRVKVTPEMGDPWFGVITTAYKGGHLFEVRKQSTDTSRQMLTIRVRAEQLTVLELVDSSYIDTIQPQAPKPEPIAVQVQAPACEQKQTPCMTIKLKGVQPRRMNALTCRAEDGMPLMGGDVFWTATGRVTTPFPKQKSDKYLMRWLLDNAIVEAHERQDCFNGSRYEHMAKSEKLNFSPADWDDVNAYLFDEHMAQTIIKLSAQNSISRLLR